VARLLADDGALEQELVLDAAVELEFALGHIDRDRPLHADGRRVVGDVRSQLEGSGECRGRQRQRDQECQQYQLQVEPATQTATASLKRSAHEPFVLLVALEPA
jgi:hypothetical protein